MYTQLYNLVVHMIVDLLIQASNLFFLKACVTFFNKFLFLSNDSPSKTMKDVFYFI